MASVWSTAAFVLNEQKHLHSHFASIAKLQILIVWVFTEKKFPGPWIHDSAGLIVLSFFCVLFSCVYFSVCFLFVSFKARTFLFWQVYHSALSSVCNLFSGSFTFHWFIYSFIQTGGAHLKG